MRSATSLVYTSPHSQGEGISVEIITIVLVLALVQERRAVLDVGYASKHIGQRQKSLSALMRLRHANEGVAI